MKTRSVASRLLGAALAAAPLAAHAQGVASVDPAAVQAGTYGVEPYHTQVGFTLSHMGFTEFFGDFSGVSGTLVLDPTKPAASTLSVTIPVGTVQTTVGKLDGELRDAQWFDVARYPDATFLSTAITPTGAGTATIAGDLTQHGVTHPVMLSARLIGSGINPLDTAVTGGFEATGTISRAAFGVKRYEPLIGDQVTLTIAAAFERRP